MFVHQLRICRDESLEILYLGPLPDQVVDEAKPELRHGLVILLRVSLCRGKSTNPCGRLNRRLLCTQTPRQQPHQAEMIPMMEPVVR